MTTMMTITNMMMMCCRLRRQFLLLWMSVLCFVEDVAGYREQRINQAAVLVLTCVAFKETTKSYVPKTSHLNYIVSTIGVLSQYMYW